MNNQSKGILETFRNYYISNFKESTLSYIMLSIIYLYRYILYTYLCQKVSTNSKIMLRRTYTRNLLIHKIFIPWNSNTNTVLKLKHCKHLRKYKPKVETNKSQF